MAHLTGVFQRSSAFLPAHRSPQESPLICALSQRRLCKVPSAHTVTAKLSNVVWQSAQKCFVALCLRFNYQNLWRTRLPRPLPSL